MIKKIGTKFCLFQKLQGYYKRFKKKYILKIYIFDLRTRKKKLLTKG